jgi:hypothetical protein
MERKAFNSLNEAALEVQMNESSRERKAHTRKMGGYKYGTGPKSEPGGAGKGADKEDDVYRARAERGQGDAGRGESDSLRGGSANIQRYKRVKSKKDAKKSFADRLYGSGGANPLKSHVEYDEVEPMVLEYFESYFGGTLNESTSDEDIMEAVYDLVDLTEAVCEAVTTLPDPDPDVLRYYGGRAKYDALKKRLAQKTKGKERKPSGVTFIPKGAEEWHSPSVVKRFKRNK